MSFDVAQNKTCLECGDSFHGRSDKKFCGDQCRVTHNNRLNSDATEYIRYVNHTLRKNRRILCDLQAQGKTRIDRENLVRRGFDFGFFTNTDTRKDGAIYYYCYEQGYRPLRRELFLLITKKDH